MRQINTSDKRFHNGNGRNEMGTIVTAEWLNAVQDELVNLVTTLGGEVDGNTPNQIARLLLDKLNKKAEIESPDFTGVPTAPTAEKSTSSTQIATTEFVKNQAEDKADKTHKHPVSDITGLQDALDEAGKKGLPVGAVIGFPKEVSHSQGFLLANGSTFSESTYPDLYRALGKNKTPNLQRSDVGMTSYFAVDNIPEGWIAFDSIRSVVTQQSYPELYQYLVDKYGSINNVPLAEDRFIRGVGRGLTVGQMQDDELKSHAHRYPLSYPESSNGINQSNWTDSVIKTIDVTLGKDPEQSDNRWARSTQAEAYEGGSETRPKSIVFKLCIKAINNFDSVMFWIKAFGSVENEGQMNAAHLAQDIQDIRASTERHDTKLEQHDAKLQQHDTKLQQIEGLKKNSKAKVIWRGNLTAGMESRITLSESMLNKHLILFLQVSSSHTLTDTQRVCVASVFVDENLINTGPSGKYRGISTGVYNGSSWRTIELECLGDTSLRLRESGGMYLKQISAI